MKRFLFVAAFILFSGFAFSQVVIEASDLPVPGEAFTRSYANPLSLSAYSAINDTGGNRTWDFSNLTSLFTVTDRYTKAADISIFYAFLIPNAYGFKIADSIPYINSLLPVTIKNIYSFYERRTDPDKFLATALGVEVQGIALPAIYIDPDVVYFLPLIYGDVNYAPYKTGFSLPNTFGLVEQGSRTTTMDAWGTIVTPYFTTPQHCLRARSVKNEVDSIIIDSTVRLGIPNTTVEYKWMVKYIHYPVLQITTHQILGAEVITSIQYLDSAAQLRVAPVTPAFTKIGAYPNPMTGDIVSLEIPAGWQHYIVELFDMQGRAIRSFSDKKELDLSGVAKGQYLARVISGENTGYVRIVK